MPTIAVMRAIYLFAFLSIVLAANAGGGFFRASPPDIRDPGAGVQATAAKAEAFACSLQVRYWKNLPGVVHVIYLGAWATCRPGYLPAINAAIASTPAAAAPVEKAAEMPGRDALPPNYDCGVDVSFDPASAGQPGIAFTGSACEASRLPALRIAQRLTQK